MAENNTWVIALAVIAIVAIVAVFGLVQMTGYMIRPMMTRQMAARYASEHLMTIAKEKMQEGDYETAKMMLEASERILIRAGLEKEAMSVENVIEMIEIGKIQEAMRAMDNLIIGIGGPGTTLGGPGTTLSEPIISR
ncbi:MAG: hypothetical protein J7K22_03800 [Nanoarchaeota archaeon]|nr:hypothetical protein [Nanoarchaeota archaeon]